MRRRLVRLDRLVLGASPEKLRSRVMPAAAAAPLTDKEQSRLQTLNYRALFDRVSPLTPAEKYERQRLIDRAKGTK